jgi:NADH-quinone oxidoreductase subunit G
MSTSDGVETIEIEIDGQTLNIPQGSMIIEAADNAGIKIPRFCYHKKLSVAANCRMCLVQVEKAPKPLPACATPVTPGMKVFTQTPLAKDAQKSVMEFLLINHPLDCPICDQGGACELQDVSLEYGNDFSRYEEARRTVKDENLGSLVATDMTRCIQCTRCVRFGQEIAGSRELGQLGRGDRVEIRSYLQSHALKSELSGNVIDLCPVGALTSKPFRFTARAWEMSQAEFIAPHDSLGSNINLHIHQNRVKRVVPKENESINETWLSDRDRFSYEGLYSQHRLTVPMIKKEGKWIETDWISAIDFTLSQINTVRESNPTEIAAFASPNSTCEEFYLLQKWLRNIGSNHIDHRIHESDVQNDQSFMPLYPSLGISIAQLQEQDLIILIGTHINHENPLIAHRIRKANLQGAKILCLNPIDFTFAFEVDNKIIVSPQKMLETLSQENLWEDYFKSVTSSKKIILLGEMAFNHPSASLIRHYAKKLAEKNQAVLGYVTQGANTAGAWLSGMVPHRKEMGQSILSMGYSIQEALKAKLKAYILLNIEPDIDLANSSLAQSSLKSAQCVVAMTAFKTPSLLECATVLLPISLYAENSGTYINLEGKIQSFKAAVSGCGESRPAWKILRVLGDFHYNTLEEVQAEFKHRFENKPSFHQKSFDFHPHKSVLEHKDQSTVLEYVTEWTLYQSDPLVRQSIPLIQSPANESMNLIRINQKTAEKYQQDILQWDKAKQTLMTIDNTIAEDCVWMPAGL